jgi:pyruvate kinase
MRRTKIISTVGPASDGDDVLDAMIAAGTDIFRLNFSHGTRDTQAASYERVRKAAARANREIGILQDLGGPKIRTGRLKGGQPLALRAGDRLSIVTGDFEGEPGRISTPYAGLATSVRAGDCLLLADGLIALQVDGSNGQEIRTTVVDGGALGEQKGITAPGVQLAASAVTPKDADDLRFGQELGMDMVAVSFVQTAADLERARQLLREAGGDEVPVIAKLERPQALDHLDSILQASDAVMVARGDLGLEMPLERVPRAQKEITRRARQHRIPVIVATQVLESMTGEARPTRAEVSDAANAVDDGVDAIMLAGETAAGVDPARVVRTLDAIIRDAESVAPDRVALAEPARQDHAEALCEAAVTLAERGRAQAIVAVTRAGETARRLSALRPRVTVFATTDRARTARRLTLYWGVVPVAVDIGDNVGDVGRVVSSQLMGLGLLPSGSPIVFVSINPDLHRRDANYLKIELL